MNRSLCKFAAIVFAIGFSVSGVFANEEHGDYNAYVKMPYTFSPGASCYLQLGEKTYKLTGVIVSCLEYTYEDAINMYAERYSQLENYLGRDESSLSMAVKLQTLAAWRAFSEARLNEGQRLQAYENMRYLQKFKNDLDGTVATKDEINQKVQEEADKRSAALTVLVNNFTSSSERVQSSFDSLKVDIEKLKAETTERLNTVNSQISDIVSKAATTEQEVNELMALKKNATELAALRRAAEDASTRAQQLELWRFSFELGYYANVITTSNNFKNITKWMGNGGDIEKLKGTFRVPLLFKQGAPHADASSYGLKETYDIKDQSIFTMLSDAGIVPVLTEKGVEEWKKRAGAKPRYYMLYKGDGDKRTLEAVNSGATTEHDAGLPAVMNWADQDTITVTGGVFVAKGDANVGATIEAFLNKHKSSGIKGKLNGAADKKTDDNLWSTNNVLNPANPAFDKSNRNNIWNLLAYCGDSDASFKYYPTDFENQSHSIVFLGDYASDWGNAFSLYDFYRAPYGSCPVARPAPGGNKQGRALEWDMVLEPGFESDTTDMKVTDDSNKPQVVEAVKMYESEKETSAMRRILSLKGFDTAKVGQVAYKKSETELGWRTQGNALKFVGTDGEDGVVVGSGSTTNTVTFASASDSNVKVTVAKEGDGVKVTIGVYYK